MEKKKLISDARVQKVFSNYPNEIRPKMDFLRKLIIETADEIEEIEKIKETLKWGEPSFITKNGSTIRIDWKSKSPNQYAMYFQCSSRLVETFKIVFKNSFVFEGNRAIIFQQNDPIPTNELKSCIKAALTYHKVKHLLTLGI